ncbi:hypothetical protein NEOLEDRAFT_26035 [Neolentinus lepideus HHB14362 ss-1]|uniref:Uncharacterized protein n=1 Tax=Neolentinus lepideus HHB14362 ss-1 TaxID=1314782 RepID=A0A165W462_9AGAM|nr:hypothetical protein NEOLEDRAFT_26035 [Neolentinus lepideus HHB14362 ss-1]
MGFLQMGRIADLLGVIENVCYRRLHDYISDLHEFPVLLRVQPAFVCSYLNNTPIPPSCTPTSLYSVCLYSQFRQPLTNCCLDSEIYAPSCVVASPDVVVLHSWPFGFVWREPCCISPYDLKSDKTTSHILYMTSLQLLDQSIVPGEIRVWAPMTTPILPDNTVVFMPVKACTPADALHGAMVMDSVSLQPFLGDPESSTYEDHLPDGQVLGSLQLARRSRRAVPLPMDSAHVHSSYL